MMIVENNLIEILKKNLVDLWLVKHTLRWYNNDYEKALEEYNNQNKDNKMSLEDFIVVSKMFKFD